MKCIFIHIKLQYKISDIKYISDVKTLIITILLTKLFIHTAQLLFMTLITTLNRMLSFRQCRVYTQITVNKKKLKNCHAIRILDDASFKSPSKDVDIK